MTSTAARPTSTTSRTSDPAAAADGAQRLTADPTGPIPVLPDDAARLDIEAVSTALKGKWAQARDTARERAARPEMARPENMSVAAHRDRVLGQLRTLAEEDVSWPMLPEHLGGPNDNGANVAAFQELVVADPSLQIKAGVQWGLFTAAIVQLGDQEQQARWVRSEERRVGEKR